MNEYFDVSIHSQTTVLKQDKQLYQKNLMWDY